MRSTQLDAAVPGQIGVEGFVGDVAGFAGHELIDERVVHAAGAGPLRGVEDGGAGDESFEGRHVGQVAGAERVGMIRRAAVAGTVQPIHGVAGLHEIMHQAGPAADAHHVQALAAAAVGHHHWVGMLLLGRDHVLHVHLALRDGPVGHGLALHAHPEAALIGEL